MYKRWILALVVVLAGCTVGPDYERPDLDLPQAPPKATLLSQAQENALAYWWTRYHDPVLNRLIDKALDDNLNIALQAARLRQARAQLGLARANLFPSIGAQAQALREKTSLGLGGASGGASSGSSSSGGGLSSGSGSNGGAGGGQSSGSGSSAGGARSSSAGMAGGGDRTFNYFSVAGTLDYELDVFGGLRRARQAAKAQLLASAYTKDSIRIGVVSDVVTNYMSLRAIERQIGVTRRTIEARKKALELDQKRYEYGAISKLPLLQTRSLLATARARLPPLKRQATQLRSSLAILTGRTPREIVQGLDIDPASFEEIHLPEKLPAAMPSLLVARRPDIRAAEAALIAANANIGVAKARFFPRINLSGMIGSAALQVDDLFGPASQTQSVAGSITAPIFEFGRLQARYDTAQAQRDAALIMYRQTVRQAFREVHDALATIAVSQERLDAVDTQVEAYRQTLDLARIRYQAGRTNFFDVLDAQRQLYSSQLDLANAIRDRFTATANLFKALGGGWTENSDSLSDDLEATRDSYAPDSPDDGDEPEPQSVSE